MTRRRRLLWITTTCGALFLGVATLAALRWQRPEAAYRPGVDLVGVTSELARSLPADYPRVVFTDVTQQAGITFQHFGGTRSSQLPEDMGSGAAWGDYDADGFVDLIIVNEVGPLAMSDAERRQSPARTALYRNNGDGTFTDVTTRSGIDVRQLGMAVAWGDYDNDGRIDVVITAHGTNVLYHNDGDGTFSDRSDRSRVGAPRGFWTGASWGDYNRDGFVDLYITGYVKYARLTGAGSARYDVENPASINPSSFRPERNLLYRNNGDGTFSEVASAAGVADTTGRGMSAAWADFDEDGWPDLYVANDQSDNAFFRNLGNGRFEDISHSARVADYRSAMGIAVGDWDGDGTQDIFLTHWLAQENALYTNQLKRIAARADDSRVPRLTFMDEADRFGLGQISLDFVGWATSFVDYDNDGRLDLFVVNGSTLQKRADSTQLVPMRNQLFWNRGRPEGFYDVSAVAGPVFRKEFVGRGGAFADYDNDGDVDVFVVNHDGPGLLLRNDGGSRNRWLQVEVRGSASNRQGIGAKVRVVVGETVHARQVGAQSSYLSQNSLIETFGLGQATAADTLEVIWPTGAREVRTGVSSNQRVLVVEGRAPVTDRVSVQAFWLLYREATDHRVARRKELAAASYEQALKINPNHEDVLYYLGGLRLELGDFQGAALAWRHMLSLNASNARAHSQLGALYLCLDERAPLQLDSAEYHLGRAHQLNKEENGPLLRLAELELLRGDHAAARRYLGLVLATHSDNASARFLSGYVAWKAGDLTRARSELAKSAAAGISRPAPAGVSGEGDTKRGSTALTSGGERCSRLRSLTERGSTSGVDADIADRYRELDSVLVLRRSR